MNEQDSWETTEIFGILNGGGCWPFEPPIQDSPEEVGEQLKESLLPWEQKEGPVELYESFESNAGNWRNINWTKLGECCLSDFYEDKWKNLDRLRVRIDNIEGKDGADLACRLRSIADQIEAGDDHGTDFYVDDIY